MNELYSLSGSEGIYFLIAQVLSHLTSGLIFLGSKKYTAGRQEMSMRQDLIDYLTMRFVMICDLAALFFSSARRYKEYCPGFNSPT
jgi:hypothetical protein